MAGGLLRRALIPLAASAAVTLSGLAALPAAALPAAGAGPAPADGGPAGTTHLGRSGKPAPPLPGSAPASRPLAPMGSAGASASVADRKSTRLNSSHSSIS